ncbi:Phosphatidylinositol 3-kinase [Scenedesmus sp. PABB004]|nr:Phosphatidylinositol 3-kinase [Scenedesmus sp. PABB004]
MGAKAKPEWRFVLSCDVDLQVRVRLAALHGAPPYARRRRDAGEGGRPTSAFAVAQLVAGGEVLGLEAKTTYADAGPDGCAWDEWLTFCVKYRDLPPDTYLCVSVYELAEGAPLALAGCTSMPLFSKKGRLKTGQQRLQVWEGRDVDACQPQLLLGKAPLHERSQVCHLEHLAKLYSRGDLPRCDWLDSLTFKEVQRMRAAELAAAVDADVLLLSLELPIFPTAVLYQQPLSAAAVVAAGPAGPGGGGGGGSGGGVGDVGDILQIHDPEVGWENPAELKAAKLARSVTRGVIDRDLKPNSDERRAIAAVLRLPPNKPLGAEAKALLWRFRFSLVSESRALTKFLKCVDWSDAQETKQACELMQQWARIDVADALELLSPDFRSDEVRAHAVAALQAKEDEELLYYLLQLVQALRFEASDNSRLARFLVSRAARNPGFATLLHWYLFTEWEDPQFGGRASAVHGALVAGLAAAGARGAAVWAAIRRQTEMMSQLAYISKELKMSRFKAARATERMREMLAEQGPCSELASARVPLPLNPAVLLEGLLPHECACFKSAQLPIKLVFRTAPHPIDWDSPAPLGGAPAPPPADPGAPPAGGGESGTLPGGADSAASAGGGAGGRCVVIYKKGDDLRQDQFVLQMISLMDNLLKRENLDLRLTPYRVLPTGSDDGLVEFVPSAPLSRVLAEHRTIHKYLAAHGQADPQGPFGLSAECLESFVRSCAGYCVATYILGVGDRHLDNLLLAHDGRLFHIDFGFILGSDPKPFPPPMKLCREMIEAMGGQDSSYYVQFRMYSCEAYNILRKSADLILSLFHLMAGASIEAIRHNPENAMLKLQEKLRLDCDDEQAIEAMQALINESATALMPQIVETTHRWAQYWR